MCGFTQHVLNFRSNSMCLPSNEKSLFIVAVFIFLALNDHLSLADNGVNYHLDVQTSLFTNPGKVKYTTSLTAPAKNASGTLFIGFANDPFQLLPPKGQLLPIHLPVSAADNKGPLTGKPVKTFLSQNSRKKRGVIQLYNMVHCATGCDPLIYKGYGCYCGFLGSGYPVDGIDKCCKTHDMCYDVADCPMYLEYVVPYYWTCFRGKSLCAIDHLDRGGSGSCAQRLCECDRLLAECLSRHPCPRKRARCASSPWRLLQNTLMIF